MPLRDLAMRLPEPMRSRLLTRRQQLRERIEQAKTDWKNGRFAPVPGDSEFIPLPE